MNIGSLGMASSIAATPLQQSKSSDNERVSKESEAQKASEKLSAKSETDAEISENESATDRDADGRQLWEIKEAKADSQKTDVDADDSNRKSIDSTGDRGAQLDLSG